MSRFICENIYQTCDIERNWKWKVLKYLREVFEDKASLEMAGKFIYQRN
jgi:hypothetical protein